MGSDRNNEEIKKCSWGEGVSFRPDGVHELDPCIYEDVQIIKNVTVIVSRCMRCGNVVIGWKLQDNSEEVLNLLSD